MAQGDVGIYASQISGHLWAPNGSFDALATVTIGSAVSEVIFSNIPQGYKHLQIRLVGRQNSSGTSIDNCTMQVNGVTSGSLYASHFMRGDGYGTPSGTGYANLNNWSMAFWAPQTNSGAFGGGIIDILDYASTTKTKTFRGLTGVDCNGSGTITLASGLFNSTNPITSIRLFGATFGTNTQFALYGVK